MSEYRVGIVGLSWITSEPARPGSHPVLGVAPPHSHLSGLATIPSVIVVSGCDIVPEARERFVENWSPTWPGLTTYADFREMLQTENLDVVCVATPDHLHGDVVRVAAESGVKGIFCEKPMSVNLADVDSMIEAIEKHQVIVNVNHTRRWMPVYVTARERLRSGIIGKLIRVSIHFGGERAMLWRNHSHFLDMLTYFAEGNPEWVTAELEPGFEDYGTAYKGDGGRSPELEPGINACFGYDNGVRGVLSGMKAATPLVNVELIGTEGVIRLNDQQAHLLLPTDHGVSTTPIIPSGTWQGMQAGIIDLLTAIETGREPQSPPHEARKTVAMIEGILQSQAARNSRISLA